MLVLRISILDSGPKERTNHTCQNEVRDYDQCLEQLNIFSSICFILFELLLGDSYIPPEVAFDFREINNGCLVLSRAVLIRRSQSFRRPLAFLWLPLSYGLLTLPNIRLNETREATVIDTSKKGVSSLLKRLHNHRWLKPSPNALQTC